MKKIFTLTAFWLAALAAQANDIALTQIRLSGGCGQIYAQLAIRNTGTVPVNQVIIQQQVNGNPTTHTWSYTVALAPTRTDTLQLPMLSGPRVSTSLAYSVQSVNGVADTDPSNNSLTSTFHLGAVNGNATIGSSSGATFSSLQQAMTERMAIFNAGYRPGSGCQDSWALEAGTYSGPLEFGNHMSGLHITAAPGAAGQVFISNAGGTTPNYAVNLAGVSDLMFSHITLMRTGGTNNLNVVQLSAGCRNIVFDSVTVTAPNSTVVTGTTRALFYSPTSSTVNGLTVSNSLLKGGNAATYLDGAGHRASASNRNFQFINNRLEVNWLGFFVLHCNGLSIKNNVVTRFDSTVGTEFYATSLRWVDSLQEVSGNKLLTHKGDWGLRMRHVRGVPTGALIANNFIQVGRNLATDRALAIDDTGCYHLNFVNNSFHNNSNVAASAAALLTEAVTNVRFEGNIFSSPNAVAFKSTIPGGITDFIYNNLYSLNVSNLAEIGIQPYSTAASAAAALNSSNAGSNVLIDPEFPWLTDLHLTTPALRLMPRNPLVPTDIDGDARPVTTFIGADEAVNVAVKQSLPAHLVKLQPNPARGQVAVQLSQGGTWQTQLIDLSGRVLHTSTAINGRSYELPLTHLAAGIYMVRVTQGQQAATLKLVVE